MKFYIMKDGVTFQGPYKTWIAAASEITVCEKSGHINLSVQAFEYATINRQFKTESGKRLVLSKIAKLHCYHTECAPEDATEAWCKTQQTCCAKCHEPLYKKSGLVQVITP